MKLQTALLLSSKKQAEQRIEYRVTFQADYILIVAKESGQHGIVLTLRIHRVSYPDGATGKGKPQLAKPHHEESFENLDILLEFLRGYEIKTNEGWKPVEDPEQPESV
ncbi:MAG TPA: hypothetical protein VJ761_05285 [Ktedonobacteraceae bacterium]|nr:hypothetical protein [Ktedonobacteraceae bacterium]